MKFYAFNRAHFVGIVPRIPTKEDKDFLYEAMVDLAGNYIPEFTENILSYTLVPENEVLGYIRDKVFNKYKTYAGYLPIIRTYMCKDYMLLDFGGDIHKEIYVKELLEAIYVTRDIKVYKEVEL